MKKIILVGFLKRKLLFFHLPLGLLIIASISFLGHSVYQKANQLKSARAVAEELEKQLSETNNELEALKNEDQVLLNKNLQKEIKNIHDTYLLEVKVYEDLLDLKTKISKTQRFDELLATAIKFLTERNYASATAALNQLKKQIDDETQKLAAAFTVPANVPQSNTPPAAGYSRQKVKIEGGEFLVDIISADLSTTKVIVDTASESDCADNCPVLSLSDYVSRNGAYAGVNGSYFCPSTYPDCVNKKNSFDTLLMNKNKKYFNSDNNVYSTVPAVIFQGSSIRFVAQSLEWGRDTGVDGVIANHPLLVFNNAVVFSGDSVAKHNNKGGRSFVGAAGSNIYIGVVRSATVLESAKVLHALGIHNALNLDDGGSTALWYSGYKVGPGRNIPNAVLFVKR